MARIRTIKPEFFRHHDLWTAERESGLPLRVAYVGMWCVADRAGRFKWRPAEIKIQVLPYDDIDFAAVLDALVEHGFVQRYTVEDIEYGVVPSLAQHQVFNSREKESSLPAPTQRQACVEPASSQSGKEGNGEGNGVPSETAAVDAATVVFNQGRDWLQRATGKSEDRCRGLLGKWRRDHGDARLIEALGAAQRAGPIDAVQWLEAALRQKARASPADAHQGFNL